MSDNRNDFLTGIKSVEAFVKRPPFMFALGATTIYVVSLLTGG